jgi:type I restriction enzyme R subunit
MAYFNIVAATNENTVVTEYEPVKKRSDAYQSEAELEKEFIRLLTEQGYEYLPIHTEAELMANIRTKLEELNKVTFSDNVQMPHRDDNSTKNITLIDKKNIHNNRLQVINQFKGKY